MQNKAINFKHQQFPSIFTCESNFGKICGYASVFNVIDHHGDIITKGAFANIDAMKVKFLWQHDATTPIGKIITLEEDDYGLYIEAELILAVNAAKEAYELVKTGSISGLSIGFSPIKYSFDQDDNRIIEEVDLWEISLVTFPANNNAKVTDYKNQLPQLSILSKNIEDAILKLSPNI